VPVLRDHLADLGVDQLGLREDVVGVYIDAGQRQDPLAPGAGGTRCHVSR
jgi:hypothetical protein